MSVQARCLRQHLLRTSAFVKRLWQWLQEQWHTPDWQVELRLFRNTLQWLTLAIIVGSIVGIAAGAFLLILEAGIQWWGSEPGFFLILPVVLGAIAWCSARLPDAWQPAETNEVLYAIRKNQSLPLGRALTMFAFSLGTIWSGGSLGKEAPAADIGAVLGGWIGRFFRTPAIRQRLMICGISAGFSAAFGTPLAGAIFGAELINVGSLPYSALLPAVVAGLISYHVSTWMGVHYFRAPIYALPGLTNLTVLQIIFLGILLGFAAFFFIALFRVLWVWRQKVSMPPFVRGFVSGLFIVWMGLWLGPSYLGLGFNQLHNFLITGNASPQDILGKTLTTAMTIAGGGVGGTVTPILFVGAALGGTVGHLVPQADPVVFTALGMVGFLAGTLNTPIAASILAIELFGLPVGILATSVCFIAFVVSGPRVFFPAQRLPQEKSHLTNATL